MNRGLPILVFALLAVPAAATFASAQDERHELPVKHALNSEVGKAKLVKGVKVFMKGQGHPGVAKRYREFKSNKRSNALGKSDQNACDVAFLSALIALQQRAEREGGNAVIDIYSVTKDQKYQSADSYACVSGSMIANVALRGTVVRLGK